MCEAAYFRHRVCSCRWAEIAEQCGPGMGFSTCPDFGSGIVHENPPYLSTIARPCPAHELYGIYDRNQCRMVAKIRNGVKWGSGPGKDETGVECPCVVM